MMKKLIVTGDDFGLAVPVNEAIEAAHRDGILTTASLMVGAAAAADAVERAKRLPSLKVGLHLVLVEGRATSPPGAIPDLVDETGEFSSHLVRAGVQYFFHPRIRRQLEKEIRAQFRAFQQTGLALDHVNAHNHMHLHPTIFALLLKIGKEFRMRAIRLPYEPPLRSWRASRKALGGKLSGWLFLLPWMTLLKIRIRQARLCSNDFVFGMYDSGRMEEDLVLRILRQLPEGVTELYFHPATRRCPELDRRLPAYHHRQEFDALLSESVRNAVFSAGIQSVAFGDLELNDELQLSVRSA
jgi:chitin disaccharide deacetylase